MPEAGYLCRGIIHMKDKDINSDQILELQSRIKALEESLEKERADRIDLFNGMITGFAECELVFNSEGKPSDFKFLAANKTFCEVTGQEYEKIEGKLYNTLFPDNDHVFAEKVHSILQGKSAPVFEFYYPVTKGYYEVSIKRLSENRFRSYFHDITFYKLAEKNLRKSEERFSLALTGTNDGLWDWDLRTDHVYYSPRWKAMLGYEPEELKNHLSTWENLVHPEDRKKTMLLFDEYITGSSEKFEIINRMLYKNGQWRLILTRALKQFDSDNKKPLRLVGTHTDVTDIISLLNNLNDLNSTKDKLFSIIAHDLRGPLSSFTALIELILENKSMTRSEINELLKEAHINSKNIYSLLENLLLWAQSQMNNLPVNLSRINLCPIITENIQLFSGMAKDKGITIVSGLAEDIYVMADSDILRFILRNLISNAIKFSYRNGIVEIITYRNGENKVIISITDHGKGIEGDRIDLLLSSSQINSTRGTENEKGSGLGLILCKDFIKKINGEITIESDRCRGTKISVILEKAQ
jgi:PAS domain S-box-containing protein